VLGDCFCSRFSPAPRPRSIVRRKLPEPLVQGDFGAGCRPASSMPQKTPREIAIIEFAYAAGLRISNSLICKSGIYFKARTATIRQGNWRLSCHLRKASSKGPRAYLDGRQVGPVFIPKQPPGRRLEGSADTSGTDNGEKRSLTASALCEPCGLAIANCPRRRRARLALSAFLNRRPPDKGPRK